MRPTYLVLCLLLFRAATANAAVITGKVIGPEGAPVADAEILVSPRSTPDRLVVAKTDATGAFAVNLEDKNYGESFLGRAVVYFPGLALNGGTLKRGENSFRLEPAGQAWGTVTDTEGKPVAGATVKLMGIQPPVTSLSPSPGTRYVSLPEAVNDRFAAKTTADGRWSLPNVPTTGSAAMMLDDARFARVRVTVQLGSLAGPAAPIVARPAAEIAGRAIYEDGRPAKGVRIFAQGIQSPEGAADNTAADGSYRLQSLSSGTYNVMVDDRSGEYVAAAAEGVTATEGEKVTVPDLLLTKGALVEGTILDEAAGKPIAGAMIGSYGPERPRSTAAVIATRSDEAGHYRLRVAPGKSYVYLMGPPQGYPDNTRQAFDISVEKGQTKTVNFRLNQGLTLSGMVVDQQGAPAGGAQIILLPRGSHQEVAGAADKEGKFSVAGLSPGKWYIVAAGDWETIEPKEIEIPISTPVKLVFRKAPRQTLTGRVITPEGEPVPGALVSVNVLESRGPEAGRSQGLKLTGDAQGRFSIADIRPDAEVTVSAEKVGYSYISGGEVTKSGATPTITDIVLAPLNAKIEGQVLDPSGKPVADAKVIRLGTEPGGMATTDAAGRFTLQPVPQGELQILAAHGRDYGEVRGKADGKPVVIKLFPRKPLPLPGNDLRRGYAILASVAQESAGTAYYARQSLTADLAAYAPDLALKLAQEMGRDQQDALNEAISALSEVNPTRAKDWVPPQLEKIKDPAKKEEAGLYFAAAMIRIDPDLARKVYEQVKGSLAESASPAICTSDLFNLTFRAGLAGFFKEPAADDLFARLISETREYAKKQPEVRGLLEAVVAGLARFSPALAEKAIVGANLSGRERAGALSSAVQETSRYDPAAAKKFLLELKTADDTSGGMFYGMAAKYVIQAVGPTDPAAALEIARDVKYPEQRPLTLAIAAQFQEKSVAAQTFREAAQAAGKNPGLIARIAAMAREKDSALGAELFAAAQEIEERAGGSVPEFAFYYSPVSPAESRLLVETDFARSQRPQPSGHYWHLVPPVLAMAAVDIDRALEMARSIPGDDPNARFDAQRKIAQYVLAPESVRRTLAFDRWGASDTWIPGTPTGW